MPTKPVRKKVSSAEEINLLKLKVKRLETKLKELERKIDHVYDLDDGPGVNDKLNKPGQHP